MIGTTVTTAYALSLVVQNSVGHSWTIQRAERISLAKSEAWRESMRVWCAVHPLPAGYEYLIPLPRRLATT